MRFGFSGVLDGLKGTPRFRVMGAWIMRCSKLILPLAIFRGWKSFEAALWEFCEIFSGMAMIFKAGFARET